MTTLYCPHCKSNVLTTREEFNWCLAIILAIFTSGFGLLIYLAIYYSKPENRCVHCHSICQLKEVEQPTTQVVSNPYHVGNQMQLVQLQGQTSEESPKYCLNCGVKLERAGKFCAYCGANIE